MFEKALQIVAPHHCYGCGYIGSLLCANCKYNITNEPFAPCINCLSTASRDGLCRQCNTPFSRAWIVDDYKDSVKALLHGYKFERQKAASIVCISLLDEVVPSLPPTTIVCAVPTISRHVRQRGYDHAALLAKGFAKRRKLECKSPLLRVDTTVQVQSTRKERFKNAQRAFRAANIQEGAVYLLLDDVVTTGATLRFAAEALRNGGAADVWVAAIARQRLDK